MRLLHLLLALCISSSPLRAAEKEPAEDPRGDRIYAFQHKLLPKWTFGSEGAFFSDLFSGKFARLHQAAADVVDAEFAKALAVRPLDASSRVLITFEAPSRPPLCYFVIVEKTSESSFRFVTLEKTEDLFGDGTKSVVGEWDGEGGHKNMGARSYADEESFVSEITSSSKQPANQALQPTPMLVTPRADARVAPSTGVADL